MAATLHANIVYQDASAKPTLSMCNPMPALPSLPAMDTAQSKPHPDPQQCISTLATQLQNFSRLSSQCGTSISGQAQCAGKKKLAVPSHKLAHADTSATPHRPASLHTPTPDSHLPSPQPSLSKPRRSRHKKRDALPRVDSLPFAMDEEDDIVSAPHDTPAALTPKDLCAIEHVRRIAQPSTSSEQRLAIDVADAYLHHAPLATDDGPPNMLPIIARHLDECGYTVHIKTAIGGGIGKTCFQHQSHTFIQCGIQRTASACIAGSAPSPLNPWMLPAPGRLIVDPNLREQFAIVRSTWRYTEVLSAVPAVFVGTEERLADLVAVLTAEVARAFKSQALYMPPWREADNIISKWLPARYTSMPTSGLDSDEGDSCCDEGTYSSRASYVSSQAREREAEAHLPPDVSIRYFKLPGGATC